MVRFVSVEWAGLMPERALAAGLGRLSGGVPRPASVAFVEATLDIDQRRLGMTWSPLGMTGTPVTVSVHALMHRAR
jgi:hypothetical protein